MKTTLNALRKFDPCAGSWKKLLAHFGKTEADGTEVRIMQIIDLLGVKDALWALRAVDGYDREKRLFAVACARRVQHKMTDPRSLNALDVAERFANGEATEEELTEARVAARAVYAAADAAYWAAYEAADWAARRAADAADWAADERAWQGEELRRVCAAIEAGKDPYPKKEQL